MNPWASHSCAYVTQLMLMWTSLAEMFTVHRRWSQLTCSEVVQLQPILGSGKSLIFLYKLISFQQLSRITLVCKTGTLLYSQNTSSTVLSTSSSSAMQSLFEVVSKHKHSGMAISCQSAGRGICWIEVYLFTFSSVSLFVPNWIRDKTTSSQHSKKLNNPAGLVQPAHQIASP